MNRKERWKIRIVGLAAELGALFSLMIIYFGLRLGAAVVLKLLPVIFLVGGGAGVAVWLIGGLIYDSILRDKLRRINAKLSENRPQ